MKAARVEREFDVIPEQRLWVNVLIEALIDAIPAPRLRSMERGGNIHLPETVDIEALQEARSWLRADNQDFVTTCWLAGLNPDMVLAEYGRRAASWEELALRDRRRVKR